MNHLSACYFCGIAMDEPLADYPVVPAELRSDGERHTVTLCPSCHQKLDTVMDVVTEAVEDSPGLELGDVPDEDATGTERESTETERDATATGDDSTSTGADAPAEDSDEALRSAMEADVPEEFETRTADATGDDENAADETPESDPLDFDAAPSGDVETDESGPDEGTSSAAEAPDPDEAESDEETPAEVVSDAGASISALEYNKVMRLLQNREFPVERDEIETVAANAYGLARSDCAEVIDLAIDRDLLGEENGQLVRPE